MLSFIRELKEGNNFRRANENEMINRLENGLPTFEATGDADNVTRMYFDVDYKMKDITEWSSTVDKIVGDYGEKGVYHFLKDKFNIEPQIAVATSSSGNFKDSVSGNIIAKYSWRYFVSNLKMKKAEMKDLVLDLSEKMKKETDIYDYIFENGSFFDTEVYGLNRKMRCIGTSKDGENRPLVLVKGSIADTLITGGLDTATKLDYVKPKPKIQIPNSPTSITDTSVLNDCYSELLNIVGNKGHKRDTWLTLCSWFVNNSTKDAFLNFVDAEWRDEAEKLFDDFDKNKRPCSVYALDNIAKTKDEYTYIQWRRKHNKFIPFDVLAKGSNDVAQYIAPRLKQVLVYCNETWIQFHKETCLWGAVKKPDAIVITHLQKEIDEARENILNLKNRTDDEEKIKELTKLEKKFQDLHREVVGNGFVSQLLRFLCTYLLDNDFASNLDNNVGYVVFKNGILNLKTLEFRDGLLQSDFITKTIPYNYVRKNNTDADVIDVRTSLKKICNWNDAHLDYYLSCIGYAMTGLSNREQHFWYLRGQTAENGKSVIFEALEKIMPNYVIKGTNTFLDKGVELKKEVPTWKGKRILWLNEVSTKMKDEDLLKAVCDGTDFKYNRNYATEAEKVAILFKLFCVSNNSLSVKGDAGIARRFKLLQFNSQFQANTTTDDVASLQFVRNKTFSDDLCGKWRDALLHLIFSYSRDYLMNDALKPYPEEWNEEAKENLADNNKFAEWFYEYFEVGVGFECFKGDFEDVMPNEFKSLKIKDELARMKVAFKYDSQKRGKGANRKKGAFIGFKKIEKTEEECEYVEA